ncbi:ECF subfamily RNA polymerase sigma-24 subunit [[Clostridium] sordellii]|uniref:sigma-70 family RNA polymerase sigma factor n=1 Tax=Paraclostridium sordellii TaxID=1505 RepID=UPI0005E257AC|nr:sigma-70 family RNA polymerase sigma factor [Paeniclostridium sordellii]CEN83120.1 ECF subfamily RNA polymerase sigma-24 subunit [[Clostridium] sordellii] [Paeniclostridium sordellii]CEQ21770.1 ECF subfamily RNA polymerase sigma-24 subunit [[Clostridium] sordellii] [Paeniclostridium sordellii]CEQ30692.1 ECF subfamily RNA polymerase sigma-24 subunit [[Clostridium] sordellii] [Paeniclostridium sordellii]
MKEKFLIKNIKKRKEKGMEMLIDEYSGFILSIVRNYLGSLKNYEEECLDDVLLAIWDNIDYYKGDKSTFKNWIGSIAKYKAINYKKKYIRELESIEIEENTISYKDKDLLQHEIKEEIDSLLNHLSEKDREIFKKYYLEDIELSDIAKEFNTNVDNLYNRISRGRKKLRAIHKEG